MSSPAQPWENIATKQKTPADADAQRRADAAERQRMQQALEKAQAASRDETQTIATATRGVGGRTRAAARERSLVATRAR